MRLNFDPITLDKQRDYLEYFVACPQKASDYSFVNLWGWAEEYGLFWAWSDGLVWIKQTIPEKMYWAPVGPWEMIAWESCLPKYFVEKTVFVRIPEMLMQLWERDVGNRIIKEETREHWDYLYRVSDLIELRGRRFHKKKNLFNQFERKYKYEYVPFSTEMIGRATAMQEDWCTWRDCESSEALSAENRVIARILQSWEMLPTANGGAILIDREMVAYTIAESLSDETLIIHLEKGNQAYKGVYQAINQMFLDHSGSEHKIVNREQDLGDEGLRKAKLSYNPVDFLKKHRIFWQ
jgi:hypothetical protein